MKAAILQAMRADAIPAGTSGRWTVVKHDLTQDHADLMVRLERKALCKAVPPGHYTHLHCLTEATMWRQNAGETVMNDFPCELAKHLEFIMLARGNVLVGGLGLGCVVRGLLARGQVEHIDIIERSPDVIKLCGDALLRDRRVTIHERDAYNGFIRGGPWDFAWWDLWADPEKSEPHLQVIHMELVKRFERRIKNRQGAWAMPRNFRRPLKEAGVMI